MVCKRFALGAAFVALLVLLWATGGVVAGPPPEGPGGEITIAAIVPSSINYQGRLTDADGNPLDGTYTMRFVLHDSEEITLWDSGDMSVPVANGLFNVELDVDPGDFNGQELWLVVFVDGEALLPRQQILPVPYALSLRPGAQIEGDGTDPVTTVINHGLGAAIRAQGAAKGIEATGMTGIEGEGDVGVRGIGILGSGVVGTVSGEANISPGVLGENPNYSGVGVEGHAGFGIGVKGQGEIGVSGQGSVGPGVEGRGGPVGVSGHSDIGVGVYGQSDSTSPGIAGVYGLGAASSGLSISQEAGVLGDAAGGFGVAGLSNSSYGGYFESKLYHGVYAKTGSAHYAAIRAVNTGSGDEAYGVEGRSSYSHGIYGLALSTSGTTCGVYGESRSPNGYGVYGYATNAGGGHGVYAESAGGAYAGAALLAVNTNTTNGIAIWGTAKGHDSTMVLEQDAGAGDFIRAFQTDPSNLRFKVDVNGNVRADGSYISPASDFAEMLPAVEGLEPGDVLVVGPNGKLTRSTEPYATNVVGVYSTNPGFVGGSDEDGVNPGKVPLAVLGVVPVKASAENGPIKPGDLLIASSTPGHAMRADYFVGGAIIGKALEGLDEGTGVIKMLVMLQ